VDDEHASDPLDRGDELGALHGGDEWSCASLAVSNPGIGFDPYAERLADGRRGRQEPDVAHVQHVEHTRADHASAGARRNRDPL